MKTQKGVIRKICNFYVNDWHLTTMMLPYIDREIKDDKKIITILENDIENNVKELLSKINLKEETKKKIESIKWTNTIIYKYEEIEKYILNNAEDKTKIDILIKGNNDYIELINESIIKVCNKYKLEIDIINCYEASDLIDVRKIVAKHDMILNTSGVKNIEQIFTDSKQVSNE